MAYKAQIPYGAYWSTPFARWQGALANLPSIEFAAHVARLELAKRSIPAEAFDFAALGISGSAEALVLRHALVHRLGRHGPRRRADRHAGVRDRRAHHRDGRAGD
ncbi:MAG: hypothetical protein M5U08_17775 [Burkholderiales bacterium]|nr:hypothetical protein [Burkholderiales bacterium]